MENKAEPFVVRTNSSAETMKIAQRLAAILEPGDWIGLTGDLGAGKTCFSKGLAKGLGVGDEVPVTSPTFTILQTYHGRLCLNHLDLYRLEDYSELVDIGYEELLGQDCVFLVEWCDKFSKAFGTDGIVIEFTLVDEEIRDLSVTSLGTRGVKLIEAMKHFI